MQRLKIHFPIYLMPLSFALFQCAGPSEKLFVPANSTVTGIHFSNTITIGDSLTLTGFEYIYNGGGVAVGDINNDGLQDIYFTGNMVSSRLYLNKGNLKFEDITEKAKVGTSNWANGVVMVDINQDGFKDIYVSVGGTRYTQERRIGRIFSLLIMETIHLPSRPFSTDCRTGGLEYKALFLIMTGMET